MFYAPFLIGAHHVSTLFMSDLQASIVELGNTAFGLKVLWEALKTLGVFP